MHNVRSAFEQVQDVDFAKRPARWITRDTNHPVVGPYETLVIDKLASRDESGTGVINPSYERLAEDTKLGVRTVKRVVAYLQWLGLLTVKSGGREFHRDGTYSDRRNTYHLHLGVLATLPHDTLTRREWEKSYCAPSTKRGCLSGTGNTNSQSRNTDQEGRWVGNAHARVGVGARVRAYDKYTSVVDDNTSSNIATYDDLDGYCPESSESTVRASVRDVVEAVDHCDVSVDSYSDAAVYAPVYDTWIDRSNNAKSSEDLADDDSFWEALEMQQHHQNTPHNCQDQITNTLQQSTATKPDQTDHVVATEHKTHKRQQAHQKEQKKNSARVARAHNATQLAHNRVSDALSECQVVPSPKTPPRVTSAPQTLVTSPVVQTTQVVSDDERVVLDALTTNDNAAVRKVGTLHMAKRLLSDGLRRGLTAVAAAAAIAASITAFGNALACEADHMEQPTHRVTKRLAAYCDAPRRDEQSRADAPTSSQNVAKSKHDFDALKDLRKTKSAKSKERLAGKHDVVTLTTPDEVNMSKDAPFSSFNEYVEDLKRVFREYRTLARVAEMDDFIQDQAFRLGTSATQIKHVRQALGKYDLEQGYAAASKKDHILLRELARALSFAKAWYNPNDKRFVDPNDQGVAPRVEQDIRQPLVGLSEEFVASGLTNELRKALASFTTNETHMVKLFDLFVLDARARGALHTDWTAAFVLFASRELPRLQRQEAYAANVGAPKNDSKTNQATTTNVRQRRDDVTDDELAHARDAFVVCWQRVNKTRRLVTSTDDAVLSWLWHYACATLRNVGADATNTTTVKRVVGSWILKWLNTEDRKVVDAGYPLAWMIANDASRLAAWGLPKFVHEQLAAQRGTTKTPQRTQAQSTNATYASAKHESDVAPTTQRSPHVEQAQQTAMATSAPKQESAQEDTRGPVRRRMMASGPNTMDTSIYDKYLKPNGRDS